MATRLLRLPAVLQRTGLSRSTVYVLMKAGKFPRPRRIGARAVGWSEDEIEAWINACPRGGSDRPKGLAP